MFIYLTLPLLSATFSSTAVLSLTITKYWAAIKSKLKKSNEDVHYEYFSNPAKNSNSWKFFKVLSKNIKFVELRITPGTKKQKEKAMKIAQALNINFNELTFPTPGTLLAVLKVPSSFEMKKTDLIKEQNQFADKINEEMPNFLSFDVVKWFNAHEKIMCTDDRFSFSMTSFGFAPNGLPKHDL